MPEGTPDARLGEPWGVWTDDWRGLLALVVVLAIVARSAWSLQGSDPFPWALLGGATLGSVAIFGPFAWLARGLMGASTRETLVLAVFGIAVLTLPFGLTALLVLEIPVVFAADAFIVGVFCGVVGVFAAERTAMPETLVDAVAVALEGDERP